MKIVPAFVTVSCCGMVAAVAVAHEKWFVEGELPALQLSRATDVFPLSLCLGVVIVSSLAWWWFVARGQRDLLPGPQTYGATPAGLTQFYGLVPLILAIHLAIPLLSCGLQGVSLFAQQSVSRCR